jgi:hypothetical protein
MRKCDIPFTLRRLKNLRNKILAGKVVYASPYEKKIKMPISIERVNYFIEMKEQMELDEKEQDKRFIELYRKPLVTFKD